MTDPRHALRPVGPDAELDLAAVQARASQLGRRRRLGTAVAAGALSAVAVLGGLALTRPGADEVLRPPLATRAPSASAPATSAPTASAPTTPAPTTTAPATTAPATNAPRRTTAPATPRATLTATGRPPTAFPANTLPDAQDAAGGQLTLVSVRSGRQDGYDRVVYELAGPTGAVPGWQVAYVDRAVLDPSGQAVAVRGSAVLQVVLSSLAPTAPPARQAPSGTVLLREVVPGTVFEGLGQSFLGLSTRAPFRVFALTGPPRVVVDVLAP